MMTSQNLQINVIGLVENCLSYNISKSGRKAITTKLDNLNWTKEIMTSSKKILTRTHVRVVTSTGTWIVTVLDNGGKFMFPDIG